MTDNQANPSGHGRTFEWDENKRRLNTVKHGIDFSDATEVFSDPAAYTFASKQSIAEQRYVTVGSAKGVLMAVIFTLRGMIVRIISARAASHGERQRYGSED
jgi:uncharacterized protein